MNLTKQNTNTGMCLVLNSLVMCNCLSTTFVNFLKNLNKSKLPTCLIVKNIKLFVNEYM